MRHVGTVLRLRDFVVREGQAATSESTSVRSTAHLLSDHGVLWPAEVSLAPSSLDGHQIGMTAPLAPPAPAAETESAPILGPRGGLKRAIDIVFALVLVLLVLPLWGLVAMAIKLTSPGPVFFRQTRIGHRGQPFTMLKFRTFPTDHIDSEFSLDHDDCPLPLGRFLRRTSIDELPQLLNILRGEMSLVGPRPERPHFAEPLSDSVPGYVDRHRVLGGITGLAQVNGFWGNTSVDERVRLDNRYIDQWSLWLDLRILAQTVPAVIRKSRN